MLRPGSQLRSGTTMGEPMAQLVAALLFGKADMI